jgi:hypothetical protein
MGAGGGGGGAGLGVYGIVLVRSTTFERVLIAFSRIGSTWCKIPNLLSKS